MASSIDQQFIEYIVKSIVGHPDAVKIDRRIDEKGVLLELIVDQEDLGRVIGKRGATAQSLRTLLRALGTKNDARYNLKIIDVGGPMPRREPSDSSDDSRPKSDDKPVPDVPTDDTDDTTTASTAADDLDLTEDEELPETATKDTDHADVISKTRAELADLDDLDV
jgi:predicted RNA-binding protein YlqC (UPF0109 family)